MTVQKTPMVTASQICRIHFQRIRVRRLIRMVTVLEIMLMHSRMMAMKPSTVTVMGLVTMPMRFLMMRMSPLIPMVTVSVIMQITVLIRLMPIKQMWMAIHWATPVRRYRRPIILRAFTIPKLQALVIPDRQLDSC